MKLVVFSDASCRYNEGVAGGAYVAAMVHPGKDPRRIEFVDLAPI